MNEEKEATTEESTQEKSDATSGAITKVVAAQFPEHPDDQGIRQAYDDLYAGWRRQKDTNGKLMQEIILKSSMSRYYVHQIRKTMYREKVQMGLIGDIEAHHRYELAMINYDKLMSEAAKGSFQIANQIDMNAGYFGVPQKPQPTAEVKQADENKEIEGDAEEK